MLLAFDIGNTNIVVGCFNAEKLLFEIRLKNDAGRTVDEYRAVLGPLFAQHLGEGYKFSQCVISSVVPPVTPDIVRLTQEMLGVPALVVGPGVKTGLAVKVHEPSSVGSDRVVNAVAAKHLFGCPALVIDFGTATSFDLLSAEGNYEGGVIAPGVGISLDSLVRNTAKLPRIELAWPKSTVGKSTVGAMQSGAVLGYLCLVDGLVNKIIEEVGPIQHIIATGGLGKLFSEHSSTIKHYDAHLTLKGLRIIAELNQA